MCFVSGLSALYSMKTQVPIIWLLAPCLPRVLVRFWKPLISVYGSPAGQHSTATGISCLHRLWQRSAVRRGYNRLIGARQSDRMASKAGLACVWLRGGTAVSEGAGREQTSDT